MGFLSRRCSGKGPHLALRGESPEVSRVAVVNLGFLLSCNGDLNPAPVASEKSSLHSSCEGPLGIPLQSGQGIWPHLKLRPEPQGSSPVLTWISGFLWSFNRKVRPCLVWRHGTLLPSRGFIKVLGFLSSGHRGLGLFLELPRGFHTSFHVLSRSSGFQSSQCRGIRLTCSG